MIYHFILNPKSGSSPKQKKLEPIIKAVCSKRQLNYHIYYTTQTYIRYFYIKKDKYFTYLESSLYELINHDFKFISSNPLEQ